MPVVSVVMPAYNGEKYIHRAILSVLNQTLQDWELIVVDDGSTDKTLELIQEIAGKEPRIQMIRNEKNMGPAASRNRALPFCKGEFVAFLDSDDLWYPRKLERQVHLARQKHAQIVYCSYAMIDENDEKKYFDFLVPEKTDFSGMLVQSAISSSTALIRRDLIEKHRFPVNVYHEDLAFWLQLLQEVPVAFGVREVLAAYRVCAGSRASNKFRCALNRWRVYRRSFGISLARSSLLFLRYTYLGLKKYRRRCPGERAVSSFKEKLEHSSWGGWSCYGICEDRTSAGFGRNAGGN